MVERNPWYTRVKGPFPEQSGCVGVKDDGGGSMRGRGTVGKMLLHRAVFNRDIEAIEKLLNNDSTTDPKTSVNEVEGAGNTPLHNAAYDGWCEGIELLVRLGAKLNASNNAGDTPWQWAANMRHDEACDILEKLGADKDYRGRVIVPEHIPKIKDFYELEDGKDHPPPSQEFLEWQKEQDRARDASEAANWDAWSAPGDRK